MDELTDMQNGELRKKWRAAIALTLLIAASLFVFLFRLGNAPLLDYDEAAYARVIAESTAAGNVFSFRFIGQNWFDKPPFYFWSSILALKAFASSEFALRLPSALAAVLCVVLTYLLALELSRSRAAGLYAGAVLLSTAAFIDAGRQVRPDTLVLAAILFAFYAFLRGLRNPRWFLLFGAAIGVGVMSKSVIGLLAYPLALIAALFFRQFSWLKDKWFWMGQGLAFLIAAPWHIYMSLKFGEAFWKSYLLTQVVMRYQENLIQNNSSISTYISYLYDFASPWIGIFLACAVVFLIVHKKLGREAERTLAIPLVSALFLFAGFSMAQTKITYYLLPIYPFAAIFIALFVREIFVLRGPVLYRNAITILLAVALIAGFGTALYRGYDLDPTQNIEHRLAGDEKAIGTMLAREGGSKIVYFSDDIYWETVRYYSNGRTLKLFTPYSSTSTDGVDSPDAPDATPFLIIVPTYKVNHYDEFEALAARSEIMFKGDYFTLLKVYPPTYAATVSAKS